MRVYRMVTFVDDVWTVRWAGDEATAYSIADEMHTKTANKASVEAINFEPSLDGIVMLLNAVSSNFERSTDREPLNGEPDLRPIITMLTNKEKT